MLSESVVVIAATRPFFDDDAAGEAFAQDLVFLRCTGIGPVVVQDAEPVADEPATASGGGGAGRSADRRLLTLLTAQAPLGVGITLDPHAAEDDVALVRTLLDDGRIPVLTAVARGAVETARLLAEQLRACHLALPVGHFGATLAIDPTEPHSLLRQLYELDASVDTD
ncbi:hypothetical protein [Streptomyces laurentii]|uniref:hypothetical protein n=1 Tax=Streptomyces laurentii TaxID=39478 RepID=UPI0036C69577